MNRHEYQDAMKLVHAELVEVYARVNLRDPSRIHNWSELGPSFQRIVDEVAEKTGRTFRPTKPLGPHTTVAEVIGGFLAQSAPATPS